ncbi:hypothetical protein V6S02_07790 [Microbacterium sp. CCNWLW134]|uniref:hypothetical protein n=1 Tax=Microbacterium sp. CCNWLW134 TaxID=3122064 RepID=UPI00300FB7C7
MTDADVRSERIRRYLDDADAAIERHVARQGDFDEGRRAIDSALQAMYRAFNGLNGQPAFWDRADADDGLTLQALIYVRGRMEHDVLVESHEEQPTLPGDDVPPSDDLLPGSTFRWLPWEAMKPFMVANYGRDKKPLVEAYVAGEYVLPTLYRGLSHLRTELSLSEGHE